MARVCPFEIGYFMLHARPAQALRRLRPGWQQATVSGNGRARVTVPVCYLSAANLQKTFAPHFKLEQATSLGLFIPPPYLDALYRQHRRLWDRAASLERRLRGQWPWRNMGDHIVLVLRKS